MLVVDDLDDTAVSFAYLLGNLGHLVEFTTHPEAALVIARRFDPEFAFIDIGMPRIDGWQLARLLKSDERTAAIRLVAITGYVRPDDERKSRDSGFEAHWRKPVDVARMEALLADPAPPSTPEAIQPRFL
ncbi:MAG: response regulator [Betaproteobacteria bacterium]|nr:response regulator [Betaproteobacteria bacterium]